MMVEMGMAMDMSWSAADVFFTFTMWAVMMVGMMTGSAAPVLLLFAAAHSRRAERGGRLAVLMFGLGYITIWVGFSACAALAQWVLHETALLSPAMKASSPYLAGAILIVAGAYQLTPWKGACLTHCRSPLGFLMTNWRDGQLGALRMGIGHGAYCLGCCWALMCVLFVVGVMSLVWVAAPTTLVLLEKTGPAGRSVARAAGAAMALIGILLPHEATGHGRKKNFTPNKRRLTDAMPHAAPQNQYGRNNDAAITATSDGIGPALVRTVRVNK
jgi:predicted metal-binding membrane protein